MMMTDYLESEFFFEELSIVIGGKISTGGMFDGTATLTGDDDGFYVTLIELSDGTVLKPKKKIEASRAPSFEEQLFDRISDVIENPKTSIGKLASSAWDDVREDARVAA